MHKIIKFFDIANINENEMNKPLLESTLNNNASFKIKLLVILLLGIGFRLFQYFYNRSLWMDEVYLCSSFTHLGYLDLATQNLDYDQKAPIGFLWIVKLMVDQFGYNEMSLRLIPLFSGMISLFVFSRVCKSFLTQHGRIIAMVIISFSPALIYHSVEIKQYSTEFLATILCLYLFTIYENNNEWQKKILWGIFGGILVWFSFSVIFILAGLAVGLTVNSFIKRDWQRLKFNMLPFSIWLLSFVTNYLLFTHKHAESQWIVYFFKVYENFMPLFPHTIGQLKWFPKNFFDMLDYPLGLYINLKGIVQSDVINIVMLPILPGLIFFCGIFSLFKYHRKYFYILIMPVILMCAASGIYLYPLVERFWVFIAPIFIIFIAVGSEYLQKLIKSKKFLWVLTLLLLIAPIVQSTYLIIEPQNFYVHKKSYEKESLLYIDNNFIAGDAVYNYWNNAPGYNVYKHIYDFRYKAIQGSDFRSSSKNLEDYNNNLKNDFKKFKGCKRVWLVFNNQFLTDIGDKVDDPLWYYKNNMSPNDNLIQQLSLFARPISKHIKKDITIYLFESFDDNSKLSSNRD